MATDTHRLPLSIRLPTPASLQTIGVTVSVLLVLLVLEVELVDWVLVVVLVLRRQNRPNASAKTGTQA